MYDSAEVFSVDLNKLSLQGLDEVVYPLPVNKTPTSITRDLILKHLCFENKVNKLTDRQIKKRQRMMKHVKK